MIQQNVILVDEHDREVGLMEKMEAHQKGLLHRAFSVLVFNENGDLLLQRRAFGKGAGREHSIRKRHSIRSRPSFLSWYGLFVPV